jgi:hypothetical protein
MGTPGKWVGTSTSWNTASNWENILVPDATTDVSITPAGPVPPTFTGDFALGTDCNNLSMAAGAEFTVTGDFTIASGKTFTGNGLTILHVGGDWENNGTFTPGNGTVEFYGSNSSNINIPTLTDVYLINDDISTWPGNWNGDIGAWGIFPNGTGVFSNPSTNNAGGASPEAGFQFLANTSNYTRVLYYNPVNTSGLTSLTLDFKHMLDDYDGSGEYTIKVQYSTDGTNWFDSDWSISPGGNINATQVSTTLNAASHEVGASNYYIAFTITGNLYNVDYWYIDDVQLYYTPAGNETFHDLIINKTNAEVTTTGAINVNDLVIKPSSYFTNPSGNNLTLNIGNELTLESNENGTASFIDEGTTTVINGTKIQYYCESNLWHYMSACFDSQGNTFNLLFPGPSIPTEFYRWDESHFEGSSTGWWIDILTGSEWGTGTFIPGQGYAISDYSKGTTYTLSGDLYNTTKTLNMTKTSGSVAEGWNLVGNPFPCSVAANSNADGTNNFLATNASVLDASYIALYLYNDATQLYTTINNTSAATYISNGQGFLVKTALDGNDISFNIDDRKHGAAVFYKGGDETQRFFLTITSPDNSIDETEIVLIDGMSYGLDPSYDAGKYKGNQELSLYTSLVETNGQDFAIQALPILIEPVAVHVGFIAGLQGNYSFTVEMQNFEPNTPVTLVDKYTSKQVDLASNPQYSFVVDEPGTYNDRFLIYFKSAVGIEDDNEAASDNFQIYTIGNQVMISSTNEIEAFSVSVFNSIGQLMVHNEFKGSSNGQINIAPPGAYIVRVVSEKGVITKKVIVR